MVGLGSGDAVHINARMVREFGHLPDLRLGRRGGSNSTDLMMAAPSGAESDVVADLPHGIGRLEGCCNRPP
jgi:hypothetical protein